MEPYLLKDEELKELVVKIPCWEINNEQIQREFNFYNFIEAFSFMTKIALICEKYNHHPNWENVYSKVIIRLSTHDLGGITNLDQTLASEINKVFDFRITNLNVYFKNYKIKHKAKNLIKNSLYSISEFSKSKKIVFNFSLKYPLPIKTP